MKRWELPGFTADASVYRTSAQYLTSGPRVATPVRPDLVPAQMPTREEQRKDCYKKCKREKPFDLDWAAACSDYCYCVHMTDNPKEKCEREFKETTGQNPPLALLPPTCGDCFIRATPAKTCTITTGPGEDAKVTVPCSAPFTDCDPCFYVLEEKRTCCQGDSCWTEPCPLPTPASLPYTAGRTLLGG